MWGESLLTRWGLGRAINKHRSGMDDVEISDCGASGMNQISKAPIPAGFMVI